MLETKIVFETETIGNAMYIWKEDCTRILSSRWKPLRKGICLKIIQKKNM